MKVPAMTEFELKFEVPPGSVKGVLLAMQQYKTTRLHLQASYFDTDESDLAKCGIAVRLRKEGGQWMQTAKGQTADLLDRLEHNAAVPAQLRGTVPALEMSRHQGTPIGEAIAKALGQVVDESCPGLHVVYKTDIKRVTVDVICNGSVIEIAFDQGHIFLGEAPYQNSSPSSISICEIEFELKHGFPFDAIALARQWSRTHGLSISTITKSMKGQRLSSTGAAFIARPAPLPTFRCHVSGNNMFKEVIANCLGEILPNVSELASGSSEPEQIHKLRVGIRRLRTAINDLNGEGNSSKYRPDVDVNWEQSLISTFRALGHYRDNSYLAQVLQPQLLAAGGPVLNLKCTETAEPANVAQEVRKPEFQDALLGLLGFFYSTEARSVDVPEVTKKQLARRLEKLRKRVLQDGKKFLALDEEQQHSVRKKLKRLRYLMEFSAPFFADGKVKQMGQAIKPAQDALGLHNDESMALHAWRALAAGNEKALFGVGWLTARKQSNVERCQKKITAFEKIKPFWHP